MSRRKPKHDPRRGFWATVETAIQSGWGPTIRLMCVVVTAGLLSLATLAGGTGLVSSLRALLP